MMDIKNMYYNSSKICQDLLKILKKWLLQNIWLNVLLLIRKYGNYRRCWNKIRDLMQNCFLISLILKRMEQ